MLALLLLLPSLLPQKAGDHHPGQNLLLPLEVVPAVHEIASMDEFQRHVLECPTLAVVKFYRNGCRACRALNPKFEALAQNHAEQALFFAVNLATCHAVFRHEGVQMAPLLHVYCGGVHHWDCRNSPQKRDCGAGHYSRAKNFFDASVVAPPPRVAEAGC